MRGSTLQLAGRASTFSFKIMRHHYTDDKDIDFPAIGSCSVDFEIKNKDSLLHNTKKILYQIMIYTHLL